MTLTRNRTIGLTVAAAVFALDQLLKWVMIVPLALREVGLIPLIPVFDLRWTENRGVSLGLLQAETDIQRWLLVGVTAAVALVVLVWLLRERLLGDILAAARWYWAVRSAISSTGRGSAMSSIMPTSISANSARSTSSISPMPPSPSAS
jgi:Signal peptidase (SPase) II